MSLKTALCSITRESELDHSSDLDGPIDENDRNCAVRFSDDACTTRNAINIHADQVCSIDHTITVARSLVEEVIEKSRNKIEESNLDKLAESCVETALERALVHSLPSKTDIKLDSVDSRQNDSRQETVISPYLDRVEGENLRGANYAPTLTLTTADNPSTRSQETKMDEIESIAAVQVARAIENAQKQIKEEHLPATQIRRRKKEPENEEKATFELLHDPTSDRSDDSDFAQIGFVAISLITLFLVIKLMAKLFTCMLDFINQ